MEIIGHKKQKEILSRLTKSQNVPHAILFSGPEKIGKKEIAIEFSKELLGGNINTDFFLLEPEDNIIKIEELRNLQEKLSLKPYNHNFKIGIIDNVHLMRKEVQNAFLKTLEEPRGNSILILITHFPSMLLETILSRVQEIKFSLVSREDIEKYLIESGAKKEQAKEISLISSGQIGKAIEYFKNPEKLEIFNEAIKDISSLARVDYYQRFNYAKKISELDNVDEIIDIWQRYFRREMILMANKGNDLTKTKELIKYIDKTRYLINSTNANKKLVLENLLLRI
ncbi:MAG: DNA polymerase III subunit delta' C-terminal domain-containing protein [Candidatus Microsyncoccus archaeolyticus]|nr:MAG: DNA polymerase III subunit delta' C-terminal domain-containing protein [Candidatus Parcubacteria bacterium]